MKPVKRQELKTKTKHLANAIVMKDHKEVARLQFDIANIYNDAFQERIGNVWHKVQYEQNVRNFATHKMNNLNKEINSIKNLKAEEFQEALNGINKRFNEQWLNVELDTIESRIITDKQFENYAKATEEDPTALVVWHCSEDETTCDECNDLEGTALPWDDSFWDENTPGCIHCNCHCYTELEYDKEPSDRPEIDAQDKEKNITEPKKSGKIFKI